MSISYNTSNQNYQVIIPFTKQQILAMNQIEVPIDSSYAPYRNRRFFGVFCHTSEHEIYFSPNYDYISNGIPEYQYIINPDFTKDRYSIFGVLTDKTLSINYNN